MRSRIDRRDASGATRRPMIPQPARSATRRRAPDPPQDQPSTTYRSRDASLSAIGPSGPQTTMSSMRAPYSSDEVDPGLDRERHPFPERLAVAGDDVRVLVALEADPVPGPVEERLPEALRLDRVARGGIDRLGRDARADRPRRGLLGAAQDGEQVAEPLVGTLRRIAAGHPQRAGDVRVVAADGPADIEHDRLAGPDHAVRRPVVGRRGIGPGPDDGEFGVVVALGDQSFVDLARDILLGPPDQPAGGDLGDDPVGGVGRLGQQGDLVVVLDDAQLGRGSGTRARRSHPSAVPGAGAGAGRGGRPRRRCENGSGGRRSSERTISATRAWASLPSSHGTTGRNPAAAGGQARAGVASRRGATRAQSPSVGMTSIVSRSSDDAG